MSQDEPTLRAIAQGAVDRIAAIRDDVKVRLHLAGMEAKDAWKEAEPHVAQAETELRKALDLVVPGGAEKVRLELKLGLKEAGSRVAKVEPQLAKIGAELSETAKGALSKLQADLKKIEL